MRSFDIIPNRQTLSLPKRQVIIKFENMDDFIEWSNIKKKNRAAGIIEENIILNIMKTEDLQALSPKVTRLYEALGELMNAEGSYKKSTIKEIRKAFSSIQNHSKFWDTIERHGEKG